MRTMKMESGLYQLVYEYFKARILYGFYGEGDKLPSAPKIGSTFHLAPATVRVALSALEQNGYIRQEERKTARVAYKTEPGQFRRQAAEYFVPRETGIRDLAESGWLILDPLWQAGLARWQDEDWDRLMQGLTESPLGLSSVTVEFFILALSGLKNQLALNLYWETVRYNRYPYLRKFDERMPVFPELRGKPREEVLSFLGEKFKQRDARELKELSAFISEARAQYALEKAAPVPFCWSIYRQRPQLRYTLVSQVIREILRGDFPVGSYLPTIPQMAKRYGVGANTVRRALSILSLLGVTRSFHGKGTLVCMEDKAIDFSNREIAAGFKLYRETMEILSLTSRQVALSVLQAVSSQTLQELQKKLTELEKQGKCYFCFELFSSFIEQNSGSLFVKECYGKFRDLMVWGYPYVRMRVGEKNLDAEYRGDLSSMKKSLSRGELEGFADAVEALCRREWKSLPG